MYNKKEVKNMDAINPAKLNRISQTGAKLKMEKFEENLSAIVKKLRNRAEREVCEYGSFKTVKENLKPSDDKEIIKDLALQITPLPRALKDEVENFEKLRYLELVAKGPKGQKESVILKRGEKDEILNTLNQDNLLERIKSNTEEFKSSFLEDN